jgi:hypothetical protein
MNVFPPEALANWTAAESKTSRRKPPLCHAILGVLRAGRCARPSCGWVATRTGQSDPAAVRILPSAFPP